MAVVAPCRPRRRTGILAALALTATLLAAGEPLDAHAASGDASFYALTMPLTRPDGSAAQMADWRGRQAIIAMDHTQSLVVCSDTIRRLRAVQTAADRLGKGFDYIVISLDPQADTPAQWARYKAFFDVDRPGWHFLNAGVDDTQALIERLGIRISYDQGYRFHAVKLFRVDASGYLVRTLEGYDRNTEAFLQ